MVSVCMRLYTAFSFPSSKATGPLYMLTLLQAWSASESYEHNIPATP